MIKLEREEVIRRLIKNGLKPKYNQGNKFVHHFECSKDKHIGIKLLGYLDFLNTRVIRKARNQRR